MTQGKQKVVTAADDKMLEDMERKYMKVVGSVVVPGMPDAPAAPAPDPAAPVPAAAPPPSAPSAPAPKPPQ
jgi:hypothetical protein